MKHSKPLRKSRRSAPIFLTLLATLPILLGSCASEPSKFAPTAAIKTTSATPDQRRAEIRRQIAAVCPKPLSADELDRAATIVERYATDGDVTKVVGRQFKMDSEARVCRGIPAV